MDDQELRKLIERLHTEIGNTQNVDERGQELLRHLQSDIRELLERTGGQGIQVQPAALQRLQDGLQHFETTHPALTTLLARLLETLSNAGI